MNKMLDLFKQDIASHASGRYIQVKVIPRLKGLTASQNANEEQSDPTGGTAESQVTVAQRQHIWVTTMDEFRKSLVTIHGVFRDMTIDMESSRIKVALIYDGLELSQLLDYNGIVTAKGQSYYPPSGRTENPWYRSSDGHGTIMANMIARVNPWVSLHVLRVHNKRSSNGERTIFAESAAEAIWGAIRRQVNIISISWTIKGKNLKTRNHHNENLAPDPDAEAIDKLEAAIAEAVKANILIFCSASDQIEEDAKDSLPYRMAPSYVFRIGAALPHGQSAPETEDKGKIDYFFTGTQVAEDFNPQGSKMPRYHDGSSVGTALAAGLASLIMYCAAIMREYTKARPEGRTSAVQEYYAKVAAALQNRDNLKQAFDNIGIGKPEDKYLEVWREFGAAADKMAALATKGNDTGEERNRKKMEELDELVTRLCHKIE